MELDFGGDFLNGETCKAGDIVTIKDAGVKAEIENKGKKKEVVNFAVEVNEKPLIYTPGKKAGKTLIDAWGKESNNWIGKQFTINIVLMEIAGVERKVIRPVPIENE